MAQLIDKDALVAEIKRSREYYENIQKIKPVYESNIEDFNELLSFIDTLEVKDPYEQCIQYASIESGIKAHAEDYSFNIESELFNQLTKEQQTLWRKEIEQACISGGYNGLDLAKDPHYEENSKVKEVDTWHLQEKEDIYDAVKDWGLYKFVCIMKDGTIQRFNGSLDEDCEGYINVHIDGINDDYDNVDDIVKWIEFT